MTIKELKEKIKENPNKVMNVEWAKTVPIKYYLETLNENLDVKEILKDKYLLTYPAKKCLKELCEQYDNSFIEEVKKFIDFARKQLPNYTFDYKVIDKQNIEIDCIHISDNMLKCKTIHFTKGTTTLNINDYSKYMAWIKDIRDERYI